MTMYKNVDGVKIELTSAEIAEIEAEEAEALAEVLPKWRETASITKQEFGIGLFTLGIILDEDGALSVVKGDWPAVFAGALDAMTPSKKTIAKLTWAGAQTIGRNHPLIGALQKYSIEAETVPPLTDELIDRLFGWSDAE